MTISHLSDINSLKLFDFFGYKQKTSLKCTRFALFLDSCQTADSLLLVKFVAFEFLYLTRLYKIYYSISQYRNIVL